MRLSTCWIGLVAVVWMGTAPPVSGGTEDFVRADANQDGLIDISDGIFVLSYLMGGTTPLCPDAADANDSGTINIVDAVHIMHYLFIGDTVPMPPFPDCGTDPTVDALGCPAAICP